MNALSAVTVPDIGDFKDIPVIEILVKPGDRVAKDTPLVVLESDKATLDVPAPIGGTIKTLQISIGDRVSAGTLLLTLVESADEPSAAPTPTPAAAVPAQPTTPPVVASILSAHGPATAMPEAAAPPRANTLPAPVPALVRQVHASPSMRRIAREFGIELSRVTGSGPRGRIVRDDLQRFVKATLAASDGSANSDNVVGLKLAPWPQIDFAKFGATKRTPLSKIRKISAANLARNAAMIPHVTNFEDADITDLEAFRKTLRAQSVAAEAKITLLPFLIKAVTVTLAKFPEFNSSLDGDELVLKQYCHIGFAADTPNGLVVPVIRDADGKGVAQISGEAVALAARARGGKLTPADMQGGCFTVSSLGSIGGTGFTPIINAPEVAILGVTRAQIRPVWSGAEFRPRLILPLALAWDHRVVDGAAAARFLVHLAALLADFRRVSL